MLPNGRSVLGCSSACWWKHDLMLLLVSYFFPEHLLLAGAECEGKITWLDPLRLGHLTLFKLGKVDMKPEGCKFINTNGHINPKKIFHVHLLIFLMFQLSVFVLPLLLLSS